ncbi:hypothetical protein BaRGS_00027530 [Batillaria attramentaria]|uniref:Uncharacterized protein n=1 Tax=Batillaria attramentaria TaxID=370345 RepID=A0ABD0K336_9CAEN
MQRVGHFPGNTWTLSAAERQRQYRARRDADPERRRQYLLKERAKYRKNKLAAAVRLVTDMTASELREEEAREDGIEQYLYGEKRYRRRYWQKVKADPVKYERVKELARLRMRRYLQRKRLARAQRVQEDTQ